MTGAREAAIAEGPWPAVMAPGKLFLAGEYGVLVGAPALLMAVDRYVRVTGPDRAAAPAPDALIQAVIDHAAKSAGLMTPELPPAVSDEALRLPGGAKLGLGSSAAKAAAVAGSLFVQAGEDILSAGVRRKVLDAAWQAHRAAGGGSGADVATSVFGGVVRFEATGRSRAQALLDLAEETSGEGARPASPLRPEARPARLSPGRLPLLVHGGAPLSSREALTRLGAGLRRQAGRFEALLADVEATGTALVEGLLDPNLDDDAVMAAVRAATEALEALTLTLSLGAGAGTEAVSAAQTVAKRHGGAAKPSGAGGGDLVLVFLPRCGAEARKGVVSELDKMGLHVLQVGLDTGGVRPYSHEHSRQTPAH